MKDYLQIDDDGECSISHKNFTNDLTSYLNQLREEETLCDITIIVNQRQFPAHKVVLCAPSSYFTAMFTSGFQETSQSEITIDGNTEAFKRLLNYAYTGVIRLNSELVGDVISTASYLQFNKVVPLCANFLRLAYTKKLIRLPDAFNIFNIAAMHEFHLLKKLAETHLAENFVEFSETDVFLKEASHDYVESVLKRKDLVLWAKEEQILKGVVAWLKHDWRSRKQYTVPFLRLIRLGLVPVTTLKQLIDSDLHTIPECREMIDEVEKCLALEETSKTPLSFQFPDLFASRGMELGMEKMADSLRIDDKGECSISHKNYTNDLTSHLNQLRKEETLCDITIIVNQRRFPAHKVVLCAASSYFTAMFTSGFQVTSQSEITIDGNAEAFERLLNYAYTGVIRLNSELVGDVISTASYLQFNEVVPLCANFLSNSYTEKLIRLPDAFNILNIAAMHELHLLKKLAETHLAENFVEFSETDVFLKEASHDYVESVLKRKDLVLWAKEEQILKGVVAWLKHDWRSRKQYTVPFLRLIRLGLVPLATLKQLIDSDLHTIPECREMIDEVEKCLALEETSKTPLSFQFPNLFASRGMEKTLISINQAVDPAFYCIHYCNKSGWQPVWQALSYFPNVPVDRYFPRGYLAGYSLVVAHGQLYLDMDNYLLRYDSKSNKWVQMESKGVSSSHCATVALGDYIYNIGGYRNRVRSMATDVERFNLIENKWETVAPMPCPWIPMAVVFRDQIIVHSHNYREGSHDRMLDGHIACYDHLRDTWRRLVTYDKTPMNSNWPIEPLLVVHEDRLYVVNYMHDGRCVQEVVVDVDENGMAIGAELKEPQDVAQQKDASSQVLTAFCIGDQMFANLKGYPYKLHSKGPARETFESLTAPDTLESIVCCLEFDLDVKGMSKGS